MKALDYAVRVALALLATCHAASLGRSGKSLRFEAPPLEPNVVLPLTFDQHLLVCNAYPGTSPLSVKRNGQESQADQSDIKFQECRNISGHVRSKDKLDFIFANSGIQGTFEVNTLPDSDALLLLVVGKRDAHSPLVSFQSFAFPAKTTGKNANLAIIDAYKGNSSSPHLRMEDHVDSKERKTISKRVEQLSFNRIYAIEEGNYDASISDHLLDEKGSGVKDAKRTFHLSKRHNYVILRTGGGEFPQSLVVYPQLARSSARGLSASFAAATCLAVLFARLL